MEFQKIVKSFTEKFDEVSKIVEKEKMKVIYTILLNIFFHLKSYFINQKAIGSRNAAKSMQKQVEGQIMQLKALFNEKLMELDRYFIII